MNVVSAARTSARYSCPRIARNASSGPYDDDESPSAPRPTQARKATSESLWKTLGSVGSLGLPTSEPAEAAESPSADVAPARPDPAPLRATRTPFRLPSDRRRLRARWRQSAPKRYHRRDSGPSAVRRRAARLPHWRLAARLEAVWRPPILLAQLPPPADDPAVAAILHGLLQATGASGCRLSLQLLPDGPEADYQLGPQPARARLSWSGSKRRASAATSGCSTPGRAPPPAPPRSSACAR